MSKVSFREIVTMRTVEPIFNDDALERLLYPTPKESSHRNRTSVHEGALVPAGTRDVHPLDPSMQQQMQHQGRSIDQISSSVNHLQDTMTDLKHSFTALRIELNGPSRHMGGTGPNEGPEFDMIATVLKELKSKSEEIEKLKLEIEALKLKNRFMEARKSNFDYATQMDGALPEVKSPGLLQAGRKRAWPDAFSGGHSQPIADSFDEEDMVEDLSLSDPPLHTTRHSSKNPRALTNGPAQNESAFDGPRLSIENVHPNESTAPTSREAGLAHPDQSPAKRQRLVTDTTEASSNPEKRRPGRPRKSVGQNAKPSNIQTPLTTPFNPPESANSNPPVQVPVNNSSPISQSNPRGRPRRGRPPSKGPSARSGQNDTAEKEPLHKSTSNGIDGSTNGQGNHDAPFNATNGDLPNGENGSEDPAGLEEKRKAKVAARDVLTRMAMQREEAMETEEGP